MVRLYLFVIMELSARGPQDTRGKVLCIWYSVKTATCSYVLPGSRIRSLSRSLLFTVRTTNQSWNRTRHRSQDERTRKPTRLGCKRSRTCNLDFCVARAAFRTHADSLNV
jgi:hypothetical protein